MRLLAATILAVAATALCAASRHSRKYGRVVRRGGGRPGGPRHCNRTMVERKARDDYPTYKRKWNKKHSGKADERHMQAFIERSVEIEENNLAYDDGYSSFKMAHNQYTDMLPEELEHLTGLDQEMMKKAMEERRSKRSLYARPVAHTFDVSSLPKHVDWRDTPNVVGAIRDQGNCGSCWAFATVAALESHWAISKKSRKDFSEQHLLDCAPNGGCARGGNLDVAYRYTMESCNGVVEADSYKYIMTKRNTCLTNGTVGAFVKEYVSLPEGDEIALMHTIATVGPVSAAMYTQGAYNMIAYSEGFYSDDSFNPKIHGVDHAVAIVGYGTDAKYGDYWIVRNSWGMWGDKGYIKILRNRNSHVHIAQWTNYPIFE